MSLKLRLILRVALVLPLVAAMMFGPAGSFRFWQGWVFVGTFLGFTTLFVVYFYRRDPGLMARRLQNREPRRAQRRFKIFWVPLWIVTLLLPGFDYRFGWSEALVGQVPLWLTVVAIFLNIISWILVLYVMRFNTFASAVVQVEAGQQVISDGPYRFVRHPMYSGFILMIVATPFALGSYVAIVTAVLLVPVLIYRLRDEEQVLRQELPGYAEYCEHTHFRLIPSVF